MLKYYCTILEKCSVLLQSSSKVENNDSAIDC